MSQEPDGVIVIDNFLPEFHRTRTHALTSEFYDWKAHDGEVYRRVSLLHVPGMLESLEKHLGPVKILMSGYRLNYEGELPNQLIHSDVSFTTHAVVVYLGYNTNTGTAFWEHKATGAIEANYAQPDLLEEISHDYGNENAWNLRYASTAMPNRAIIYRGNLFHSRYPFEGLGQTPEDGRLVAIAFFCFPEDV